MLQLNNIVSTVIMRQKKKSNEQTYKKMIQGWKVCMFSAERKHSSEVSQVFQRTSEIVFKSISINKYLDFKTTF